jgi:hypothetical protein
MMAGVATMETAAAGMDEGERVRCALLHEKLTSHALAWPFLAPVDPVALNVPTYFDVISDPMDFGTMGKKLAAGAYASPDDYRADLVLMFENAIEFNKDDVREESVAYVPGKEWCGLWCDGLTDAFIRRNMARRLMGIALNEWEAAFSEVSIRHGYSNGQSLEASQMGTAGPCSPH